MSARLLSICPEGHRWDDSSPTCPICNQPGRRITEPEWKRDDAPTIGASPMPSSHPKPPAFNYADGAVSLLIPGYEILAEIGRGGMGVVYRARQRGLNRVVAMKMILAAEHAGEDQIRRFQTEAEAVAQLQHPHIVQIFEVGQAGERPFYSMELVEGGTLSDKLTGQPLPARASALLIEAVARAIHVAHERGIVHRDLKPGNILLAPILSSDGSKNGSSVLRADFPFGLPKITDFGLAKRVATPLSPGSGNQPNERLTRTGAVVGTPSYMAPEQAAGRGSEVGPAADIYALGAILYEMLTGRPPFISDSPIDTLMQVMRDEPLPPSRLRPKLARDLEVICLKCLQKEPEQRYLSAQAFADDLHRYLNDEPIAARPASTLKRGRQWMRRHPVWTASIAVAAIMSGILLVGGLDYHFRLQRQKDKTEKERNIAADEQRRAMQRLVRLTVANGVQHLDDHDLLGSLPWFAEALRLEAGNPEREEMHRIRLAAILRQSPRLVKARFHDGRVRDAAFSPDGRFFVSGGDDGIAKVDTVVGNGKSVDAKSGGNILQVAFSATSQTFLTVGNDHTVFIWSATTGELLSQPLAHTDDITSVCFCPKGKWVLTACADRSVRIWDAETGEIARPELKHESPVRVSVFHPGVALVATGCDDGLALIWDAEKGEVVSLPLAHKGAVTSMAFSPDGKRLLTGSADGMARLWEVPSGLAIGAMPIRHTRPITYVAFSPDGSRVATAGEDHQARVWDSNTGAAITPALRHASVVFRAAFSPDGRWVVTAGDDNTARIWDAQTGDAIAAPLKHNGSVFRAEFSPSGRHVLTASLDGLARLWEVGLAPREGAMKLEIASVARTLRSPDGRFELGIRSSGIAKIRDVASGEQVGSDLAHNAEILHAVFSPDGKRILTTSDDRTARQWELRTAEPVSLPLRHGSSVVFASYSPDGLRIATASSDNTARIWDAQTGTPLSPPLRHHGTVRRVVFSPDGRTVLTASSDGEARLWDAGTGESLTPALPQTGWVREALTSADRDKDWKLGRDDRPVAHLVRLAQWLSGQRIDETGGTVPLDTDALRLLWEEIQQDQSRDIEPPRDGGLSWHAHEALRCEENRQWFAAAVHLSVLIQADPKDTVLRRRRAQALAETGEWKQAAADFSKILDRVPDDLHAQMATALVSMGAGDRDGYRQICTSIEKQMGNALHHETATRLAWLCVLGAEHGHAERLMAMVERLRQGEDDHDKTMAVRGAALYRAGRWTDAARLLQESSAAVNPTEAARTWLFLSLSLYRLGRLDDARRWLHRAVRVIEQHDRAAPWPVRLEFELLRTEAETALGVTRN